MTHHNEPIVYDRQAHNFFLENQRNLTEKCLAFKDTNPLKRSKTPYQLNVDNVIKHSQITDEGSPLDTVINDFANHILSQSLNFASPNFMAHPDTGNGIAAMLGDMARTLMQQNMVSYEYSPAATYAEFALLQQIRQRIGFKTTSPQGYSEQQKNQGMLQYFTFADNATNEKDFYLGMTGGTFVYGGTSANLACLFAAREKLKDSLRARNEVYDARKIRIFASEGLAHYSLPEGVMTLGLGNYDLSDAELAKRGWTASDRNPIINVKTKHYRMDIADLRCKLEQTLEKGLIPMCIFAIAGDSTTVSFDDFNALAEIAESYGIWLHADACQGAQCLFSPRRKATLLQGIEKVDSISLDPHKVLMLPYITSLYMFKDPLDLKLFKPRPVDGSPVVANDLSHGRFTPAIGSKDFSSLRLWFFLKHVGWKRLAEEIERRHTLAKDTIALLENYPDLILCNEVTEKQGHNAVAITFCPAKYREEKTTLAKINNVNKRIHSRLNTETQYFLHMFPSLKDDFGRMKPYVHDSGKHRVTVLRFMFGNPLTTLAIVRDCMDEIQRLGKEEWDKHVEKQQQNNATDAMSELLR